MKKSNVFMFAAVALLALSAQSQVASANHHAKATIAAHDPDNDGSLDRREVLNAAKAKFDRLNPDNDRTLDAHELRGILSAQGLAIANPDGDGTLTRGEYLRLVKKLFRLVNTDGDRTIEADELSSSAHGRLLRRMIH